MWGNWGLCGNVATNMNFYGGEARGDSGQVVFSFG